MARALPPSASVAHPEGGEKLFAPAAARNAQALLELLHTHAPETGAALEIASGTGQHVTAFANDMPGLQWLPTDVDPARCTSINAHVEAAGLTNVAPARLLDATFPGWGASLRPAYDLILLINLLHLITDAQTQTLLSEASEVLAPKGTFILYGPFRRAGRLISAGDEKFDSELRTADPAIGYKDDLDIAGLLRDVGLMELTQTEMPANNLAFVARKP